MTTFSAWLEDRTEKIGGIKGLAKAMPEHRPQNIAAWYTGLQIPGYRAQIQLGAILGEPLSMVRSQLDQPHTEFSELLVRKILKHGDFTAFCSTVGINKSRLDKWVSEGKMPLNSRDGAQSADLKMICAALILWGDTTPPTVLMAELVLAAARSIVAKKK